MLAFVDMETTGLDADKDVPLELGIILTDDYGEAIAARSWLINEQKVEYNQAIQNMSPFVTSMHQKSGLWRALESSETFERTDADQEAVAFLQNEGVEEGVLGMAGNSIGSLDRPFAIKHFPRLDKFLGYRNIDMSSFKEVCKRVNPVLFEKLKPIVENKETADHRALGDCRASIREYQAYLDNFIFVGD